MNMPMKTVHCSICGKAISGVDFGERMKKLRKHRKKMHPTAHKRSVKKTLKTKRRKGLIHDPQQVIKVRKGMIKTPKVLGFGDYEADGLLRVLEREDGTCFPEFALYMKNVDDLVIASLEHSGLKEKERNKYLLRTDKFNLFVYL